MKIGDFGYLDSEGFLYVLDRCLDLIILGGENIYLVEVELVLFLYFVVVEVGVLGVEDKKWGKVFYVYFVFYKFVSVEELIVYCKECLVKYKILVKFFELDSLLCNVFNKFM